MSFYMGVAGYVNVFVAQYTGAKNSDGVGASLWQGIYFSLMGGLFMMLLSLFAKPLFAFIGHIPEIQNLEVIYFRILCVGACTGLLGTTLSCFFSGRGVTAPILLIHTTGTLFNIPLDYALINGIWLFPEWGIRGAAIATVSSWSLIAVLFMLIVFTRKNNEKFSVFKTWRFNPKLFMNLMRFGIPSGIQFFLEILAFAFFVLVVGRLGKEALAVSNIVLSINSIAYMPMFGFSMGLSTLVGQAIGMNRYDLAEKSTKITTHIAIAYIFVLTILFVFFPVFLLTLFLPSEITPEDAMKVIQPGIVLLRFVTLYLIFDSLSVIYTGTLKGAGDTRFIMILFGCSSLTFLFIPVYTGITVFNMGLYYSWSCLTFYIVVLFCFVFFRYSNGKWKQFQVIER
jgi:MATE family multidrug resistance protein